MEFIVVALAAFLVSGLTLYSGFGLGTLLMPVFAVFFSVETAVAATAVVHGANSLFKMAAVGRQADKSLVLHFGIPAIIAAFVGAAALGYVSGFGEVARYSIGPVRAEVTPLKLVMAVLMFVFALFELLPRLREIRFDRKYLVPGGLLSGFFGGFSGHQGALRAAFLTKVGISTQAFVGTNAVIGFLVDLARIAMYAFMFLVAGGTGPMVGGEQWPLIATGILAAFTGVMLGRRILHKITMKTIQTITGGLLLGFALALGLGII